LRQLQPSVVHAHDTYGIMLKGWPGPRVFTIHGFIHEDTRYGQHRMAWARSLLWKWVETAAWREQPHIVSISPYVRERLRGIARGVIHDIENPISNACFAVQSNLDPPVIFSAAVVSERKNTLSLLQAFGQLAKTNANVRLRLAGKATERAYGEAVNQWINTNTMTERVTMLGSVTAAQVRAELAGASVFALVSLEEGAPMGVAEAMAAGVPVVTSNRCGMPYMVRDGETGFLVDPLNSKNIANRLEILMSQPALRKQLGCQAHEFALNRFHPSIVARRTLAVYREAIEGNHSSARI
jgi:glycosyltransferase involved in cell wall biosynthesis